MSPNQKQIQNVSSSSTSIGIFHVRRRDCRLESKVGGSTRSTAQATEHLHGGPAGLSPGESYIVSPVCQMTNDTETLRRTELESEESQLLNMLNPLESSFGKNGGNEFRGLGNGHGQHTARTSPKETLGHFPFTESTKQWNRSSSDSLEYLNGSTSVLALGAGGILLTQVENSNQLGTNSRQTRQIEQLRRSLEQLATEVHSDNLQLTSLLRERFKPPKNPPGPSKEDMRELRNTINQLAGELKTENQQLESALQASLASRAQALKEKSQPPNSNDTALLEAITALKTSVKALATEVEEVTGKHVPEQANVLTNAISAISASAKGVFSKLLSSKSHAEDDSKKNIFAEINGEENVKKRGMFSKLLSSKPDPEEDRDSLSSFSPPFQTQPEQLPKAAELKTASISEKTKKNILSRNSFVKAQPEATPRRDTEKRSTVVNRPTSSPKVGTEDAASMETPLRRDTERVRTVARRSRTSKSVRSQATRKSSSKAVDKKPSQPAPAPPSNVRTSVISTTTPEENADFKKSVVSSPGGSELEVPLAGESRVSVASSGSSATTSQPLPAVVTSALQTDVRCYAPDGTLIQDSGKCPHYASVPYAPNVKPPSRHSKGVSGRAMSVEEARVSQQSSGSTGSVLLPNLPDTEDRRSSQASGSSLKLSVSQAEDPSSVRSSLTGERSGSGERGGSDSLNEKLSSQDSTPTQPNSGQSQEPPKRPASKVVTPPSGSSDRTDQRTPSVSRSLVSSSLADHINPLIVEALEEIKTGVAIIDREAHRRNTKVPTPPPPSPPPLPDPVIVEAIEEIRQSLRSMQKQTVAEESTASESTEVVNLLKEIKASLQRLAENKKKADEERKKAAAAAAKMANRMQGRPDWYWAGERAAAGSPISCRCSVRRRRRPDPPPPQSPLS
uniref:Apolipoprotein A1/A4/E domain n=1 Tax=Schistocephalus solidus TaxID=70667 RepID=A0A0X3Q760_SCHSO